MTDFDWLGAISDHYDNITRNEKKSGYIPPVTVPARVSSEDNVPSTTSSQPVSTQPLTESASEEVSAVTELVGECSGVASRTSEPVPEPRSTETTEDPPRRRNPPRAAKEGVNYEDQLEVAVPLSEYC